MTNGPTVLAVQQKLIGFGYYVAGGADGHFGAGTTAALRVFQKQNGLNPTGVVTENTARYLGLANGVPAAAAPAATPAASTAAAPAALSAPSGSVVGLRQGMTGSDGSTAATRHSSPRGCTSVAARTARLDHPLTVG